MATEMEAVAEQSHGLGVIFRKSNIGRTVGTEMAAFSEMWTKHGGEDWRGEAEDFRGDEKMCSWIKEPTMRRTSPAGSIVKTSLVGFEASMVTDGLVEVSNARC